MRMRTIITLIAVGLLALVVGAWYCSENFSGRLGRNAVRIGESVMWPGQIANAALTGSGNMHTRFGDWRDAIIQIAFTYFVYTVPFVIIAIVARKDRQRHDASPPLPRR